VLAAAPDHLGAQFGLANLSFDRGEFREAEIAFLSLLAAGQEPLVLWLRIGEARLAQQHYHEASEAFRQVTNRAPFHREALYKCAVALIAAERAVEGAEILDRLQHYHSDDAAHLEYAGKARAALARLELAKTKSPLPTDVVTLAIKPKTAGKRWHPPKVLH
jgi:predicted Zn-dependent protease